MTALDATRPTRSPSPGSPSAAHCDVAHRERDGGCRAGGDPRRPRLRQALHRPHGRHLLVGRAAGWHDARVEPYGPLQLDPAAAVLHYAQEIFEGLKAYRHADGSIWAFRPEAQRPARCSARRERLALPAAARATASSRRSSGSSRSTPRGCRRAPETSLYLRPFMFASEAFLGVRAAQNVDFHVIASPAGAYFPGGVRPVSIWLSRGLHARRPRRHGRGEDRRQLRREPAAAGGGVRAGLPAGGVPRRRGAALRRGARRDERRSSSTRDGRIVTPALSGTILEGITRSSRSSSSRRTAGTPSRSGACRSTSGARASASGEITEVFACGTAAVITPIGRAEGARLRRRVARRARRAR